MNKLLLFALCAACGSPVATNSAMPWVRGLVATATSDTEIPAGGRDEADYGTLQVTADIAPTEGIETVRASYRNGVVVIDAAGKLLARSHGFESVGSADDLLALSVGDAGIGSPVIALAVTRGGHRESVTSVVLYRVAANRLEQLFEGAVEDHDGTDTSTGAITFMPNGLVYRAPHAPTPTVWTFDRERRRYLERGTIAPEPERGPLKGAEPVATPST